MANKGKMLKVVLKQKKLIAPFGEPARELRLQNTPLWLWQRDLLAGYCNQEIEIGSIAEVGADGKEKLIVADNLFFDEPFLAQFLAQAKQFAHPSRLAFTMQDATFREHILPLASSFEKQGDNYLAPMCYYPEGSSGTPRPLVVDSMPVEAGYYNVPAYMAGKMGDLVYQLPGRGFIAIDSWVHLFLADIVFGLFNRGIRFEKRLKADLGYKLGLVAKALLQGKQLLQSAGLVRVGKHCVIDPSAVIHGPATIGDNVTIGAGVVIENSIIGNNVNISQGAQVMLSVVGDGTFLPFNAAVFMTTIMENSIVAQNACLQMCVIGRNTFIGAGTTFTDFNLLPIPIRATDGNGSLASSNRPVLGSAVGHNCRIGSGLVIYPGRMIGSDVVLIGSNERRVIRKNVGLEDTDATKTRYPHSHPPQYANGSDDQPAKW